MCKMMRVTAFGNPLLDTTISITNDSLLKKYNFENDEQKEISKNEMKNLLLDIETYDQKQSPGGCAQNTLRVMQWLLEKKGKMTIFGTVGNDKTADILKKLLDEEGVQTCYNVNMEYPTGTTVALINGVHRTLVAYLGAADIYSISELLEQPDALEIVEKSDLIYIEGFFLTKREQLAKFILNHCKTQKKTVAFNISAQYIVAELPDLVKYFAEQCDLLFGNKREFQALCLATGHADMDSLLKDLSRNDKIIVSTDGPNSVTCARNGELMQVKTPLIKEANIVDTTGAGDAFVGGFLSGYLSKQSVLKCTKWGCYAAQEIIQMTGCTLPKHSPNLSF